MSPWRAVALACSAWPGACDTTGPDRALAVDAGEARDADAMRADRAEQDDAALPEDAASSDADVEALDAGAATPDAGAEDRDAGGFETCPGALAERNGLTLFDLERVSFAGFTELHVTFCNPLFAEQPDHLLFRVLIDDHEGMPPSDLTRGSFVVSSEAVRVDDRFTWEGTDLTIGEHHAGGWLTAPSATAPSMDDPAMPLIGPGTTWIELHLGGIGDGQYDPFFRWDEEYLPQ